jgi:hypothetical protein
MSDVEKDVECIKQLHLSGSDKLHITSSLNDFMIKLFKERIKREHPDASDKEILKILREELSHGRRDNI